MTPLTPLNGNQSSDDKSEHASRLRHRRKVNEQIRGRAFETELPASQRLLKTRNIENQLGRIESGNAAAGVKNGPVVIAGGVENQAVHGRKGNREGAA